jgi:hypothetical protein
MTIHVAADALTDFSAEVFERVDRKSGEARRSPPHSSTQAALGFEQGLEA